MNHGPGGIGKDPADAVLPQKAAVSRQNLAPVHPGADPVTRRLFDVRHTFRPDGTGRGAAQSFGDRMARRAFGMRGVLEQFLTAEPVRGSHVFDLERAEGECSRLVEDDR